MKSLLQRCGMTNCLYTKVPMTCSTCLSPSLDQPDFDLETYRNMIGSLLYLTSSPLDIMFFVHNYVRYEANPRETHLVAIKNIFRYLHRTPTL